MELFNEVNLIAAPLSEGMFKYTHPKISEKEANNLAKTLGKEWNKVGKSWTIHDGENHGFTYVPSSKTLFSDLSWNEIKKYL